MHLKVLATEKQSSLQRDIRKLAEYKIKWQRKYLPAKLYAPINAPNIDNDT